MFVPDNCVTRSGKESVCAHTVYGMTRVNLHGSIISPRMDPGNEFPTHCSDMSFECHMLNNVEHYVELTLTNFRFSPQKMLSLPPRQSDIKMALET